MPRALECHLRGDISHFLSPDQRSGTGVLWRPGEISLGKQEVLVPGLVLHPRWWKGGPLEWIWEAVSSWGTSSWAYHLPWVNTELNKPYYHRVEDGVNFTRTE